MIAVHNTYWLLLGRGRFHLFLGHFTKNEEDLCTRISQRWHKRDKKYVDEVSMRWANFHRRIGSCRCKKFSRCVPANSSVIFFYHDGGHEPDALTVARPASLVLYGTAETRSYRHFALFLVLGNSVSTRRHSLYLVHVCPQSYKKEKRGG